MVQVAKHFAGLYKWFTAKDYVHVLDEAAKDKKLRIVQRIAPEEGQP